MHPFLPHHQAYRSAIPQKFGRTDASIEILEIRFPNLTDLTLGGRITDQGLVHLSRLTLLENLSLSGTDVEGSGLAYLSGLPSKLSKVIIDSNKLTDEGMVELSRLPTLRWLKIWDEKSITENGLDSLSRSPMLEELLLRNTVVSRFVRIYLSVIR